LSMVICSMWMDMPRTSMVWAMSAVALMYMFSSPWPRAALTLLRPSMSGQGRSRRGQANSAD
jgi:hypothetical protein